MDLADFPHLKSLDLSRCPMVTGDLRDIKNGHFLALKSINLARGIIGSRGHYFRSITDVPSTMEAIYRLSQRDTPFIEDLNHYSVYLSGASSDRYELLDPEHPDPPFCISFVRVGPRMGWRWKASVYNYLSNSCEVNWLEPEPGRDCSDYMTIIFESWKVSKKKSFATRDFTNLLLRRNTCVCVRSSMTSKK